VDPYHHLPAQPVARLDATSGTCDTTRETVLNRDGSNVVVTTSACRPTSRSWYSLCDEATWTAASNVGIDHVVTVTSAWTSGALGWTTSRMSRSAMTCPTSS
jgi:hypothetical protein